MKKRTKLSIKIDGNNVVKSYGIFLNENINPLNDGIITWVEEIDFDDPWVNLVDNYKLVDGELVKLTDEEKRKLGILN